MAEFKRIANVIPLTTVGLSRSQIFSYLVPFRYHEQICPGQLVTVSFGPRKLQGVTSSFEMHRLAEETRGFKSIEELVDPIPVMTEQNLTLANYLASYYVTPLGLMVKAMLPKFGKYKLADSEESKAGFNPDFVLSEYQRLAANTIVSALGKSETFLLHGVTGSGKTEIYMQVIARVLQARRQAIVLVPEISLTPQAQERFSARFGQSRVAVMHSGLASGERMRLWQQIRKGEKQIVIGPRSAIFAPVQSLGVIIIDEAHDSSFKQFDQQPKYHAKQAALKLSEVWQCPLVLGDATPSVETYYQAATGNYKLLPLPFRIKADLGMPEIRILDMRKEAPGNFSVLSEFLKLEILNNLKRDRQIILFLNRRGAANFVLCPDCGFVPSCTNCSANLVWHSSIKKLLCHYCGRSYPPGAFCPKCHGSRINYFGMGTQLVETALIQFLTEELEGKPFPSIARMDSDTTGQRQSATETIYKDWQDGKIQILIGTKMISKGWDVSNVGLVGIISADTMLYLPDFRAGERTFQVMTQVAGRTGRGVEPGFVILQTYNPDNYAIKAIKNHDYENFFKTEIQQRRAHAYPPFAKLVKLTIRDTENARALARARALATSLREKQLSAEILGPVPAFIYKLRGRFGQQIFLKFPPGAATDYYAAFHDLPQFVDIDIDPESLL